MSKRMVAGVSSACFFPLETAGSVQILSEWRIPNIEIFFNSFQELKDGYLERLSALCQEAGTKVVSIHPFTSNSESLYFFTNYPGRLQDGLEIYRLFLHAAQKLGAGILVFHGAALQSRMDIPQSAANLRALDRMAREEYGVTVAYENVVRCKGRDPDYFVQLREYYPELCFVLDVKQALRSGHSPSEYVEKLGNSIIHVHVSDSTRQNDCLPVGQGEMDLPALLQQLHSRGFSGTLLQEVYRESYRHQSEVLEGYRRLQSQLDAVWEQRTGFDQI